jgi:HSP20 family protein
MVVPNVWLRTSAPVGTLNGTGRGLAGLFDEVLNETWTMPAEIVESADELSFAIEVPGLRPDDIELTIENNVLTVSGEKQQQQTEHNYRLAERRYGRFSRSFRLPATVDTNRVHASCEHGVLTIRLPRAEAAKPRRIPVSGAADTQQLTTAAA